MVRNDQNTFEITKKVFLEVAKLAWAGELNEKKDDLPEQIIPGPRARFRCSKARSSAGAPPLGCKMPASSSASTGVRSSW